MDYWGAKRQRVTMLSLSSASKKLENNNFENVLSATHAGWSTKAVAYRLG